MPTPDELLNAQPRDAKEAKRQDIELEEAIKDGLAAFQQFGRAAEAGKKHAWLPLSILIAIGWAIVKATMAWSQFSITYEANALEAKAFREATTIRLAKGEDREAKRDAENDAFKREQQKTTDKLTYIVDTLTKRQDQIDGRRSP